MQPEKFIRKELEKKLVRGQSRARKLQREIIAKCLLNYKRGNYNDIDELLAGAKKRVNEYSVIGRGTTVERFAMMVKISRTTARIHLLKLERIVRNETKRPFIYTVGKI